MCDKNEVCDYSFMSSIQINYAGTTAHHDVFILSDDRVWAIKVMGGGLLVTPIHMLANVNNTTSNENLTWKCYYNVCVSFKMMHSWCNQSLEWAMMIVRPSGTGYHYICLTKPTSWIALRHASFVVHVCQPQKSMHCMRGNILPIEIRHTGNLVYTS